MKLNRTNLHGGRVAVIPFGDLQNAYLCLSGQRQPDKKYYGPGRHDRDGTTMDRRIGDQPRCKPHITFSFHCGKALAEWDGDAGPITVWIDATIEVPIGYGVEDVRDHWFFEKAVGQGNWSQMAVEEERLPEAFIQGNYEWIFMVLRRFAESQNKRLNGGQKCHE